MTTDVHVHVHVCGLSVNLLGAFVPADILYSQPGEYTLCPIMSEMEKNGHTRISKAG